MSEPTRILLIRLKSIGDILFTLPATALVRENLPHARITFLTSQENAPLLRGFVGVDEVLTIDRALYRRKNPFAIVRALSQLIRRLRAARYSLVVDFQGFGETAWLTRLTGAPQRWGNVYRPGRAWAYTQGRQRQNHLHPIAWYAAILTEGGLTAKPLRNEFHLPAEALATARGVFQQHGLAWDRPTMFLQPFSSSPRKDWPLDKYLALARRCRAQPLQVLFGGGPDDRPALAPAANAGFPVAAGCPLLVTAGLAKLASVVVGGDTGVLHLAVALEKRVVMLMHPHAPIVPFEHPEWALRPPASSLGVADIELDAVANACLTALREVEAPPCDAT